MRASRFVPILLLAVAPSVATAQGLSAATAAVIPQFTQVKIGSGADAKTVSQFSMPLLVVVPITGAFNIDLATAYASSDVTSNGASMSSINGLTDTQVRANLTVGDAVVVTLGATIPTGMYRIPVEQTEAAGQIGSDFLTFPTSTYGAGAGGTAGIAYARSVGAWNVGVGGSYRRGVEFDAFTTQDAKAFTFQPADETRVRVGVDRLVGNARLAVGATWSMFGSDKANAIPLKAGNRLIAQGSLVMPVGESEVVLSGWNVYRASGKQYDGSTTPANSLPENVSNGALSWGFQRGSLFIEPNLEGRYWTVDQVKAGYLVNPGMRLRFAVGALTVSPAITYQVGKLYDTSNTSTSLDLTGMRGSVMVRLR